MSDKPPDLDLDAMFAEAGDHFVALVENTEWTTPISDAVHGMNGIITTLIKHIRRQATEKDELKAENRELKAEMTRIAPFLVNRPYP